MSEDKDKRIAPREPVHLVAEIEVDGEPSGCGVSRDASGAGLLLMTHMHLTPGQKVTLKLYVPGEADARLIHAAVVRSEHIPRAEAVVWAYRAAVALEDPPPDLQTLVQALSRRSSIPPPTA
jgi:hypothetical protein